MKRKKLYRSEDNRIFAGIIGGLGEYIGVDPVFLRVIWVFTTIFTWVFPGVIVYIISIFIIPRSPSSGGSVVVEIEK